MITRPAGVKSTRVSERLPSRKTEKRSFEPGWMP